MKAFSILFELQEYVSEKTFHYFVVRRNDFHFLGSLGESEMKDLKFQTDDLMCSKGGKWILSRILPTFEVLLRGCDWKNCVFFYIDMLWLDQTYKCCLFALFAP